MILSIMIPKTRSFVSPSSRHPPNLLLSDYLFSLSGTYDESCGGALGAIMQVNPLAPPLNVTII